MLIADEVQSGMGRCGQFFAVQCLDELDRQVVGTGDALHGLEDHGRRFPVDHAPRRIDDAGGDGGAAKRLQARRGRRHCQRRDHPARHRNRRCNGREPGNPLVSVLGIALLPNPLELGCENRRARPGRGGECLQRRFADRHGFRCVGQVELPDGGRVRRDSRTDSRRCAQEAGSLGLVEYHDGASARGGQEDRFPEPPGLELQRDGEPVEPGENGTIRFPGRPSRWFPASGRTFHAAPRM